MGEIHDAIMDEEIYSGETNEAWFAKARASFPVKFKRLHENAVIPTKGTIHSAGYDLITPVDVTLQTRQTVAIPLGFSTEMHPSIHGRIESRSGLALKGLVVQTGVIDADYRGEWKVIMRMMYVGVGNLYRFVAGDKIAQVVFRPTLAAHWEEVSELSDTSRGVGGFGSTGR